MKTYTLPELARSIGCSKSLLGKLIKDGKITSERTGPLGHHKIKMPKYEVEKIVNEHTKGRFGFKKTNNGKAKWTKANEEQANGRFNRKPSLNSGLLPFAEWVGIEAEKRALLIKIADKYSTEDLNLLLNL